MTILPNTPESNDDDLSPLLSEPFARAWAAPVPGLPGRLGERLANIDDAHVLHGTRIDYGGRCRRVEVVDPLDARARDCDLFQRRGR